MSWLSSAIGSFTGSNQTKAIDQASTAQNQYIDKALAENARQFDTTQGNLQPFVDAGKSALQSDGGILDLLGLNGPDKQAAGLAALQSSPMFQSLFQNGSDAITAQASATGGLRGGNVQRSLADFGKDTFAQTIQQQLANLSGLVTGGSSTGANLGGIGAKNSAQTQGLLTNQGANLAGGILGKTAATDSAIGNLAKYFGNNIATASSALGGGMQKSSQLNSLAGLF